MPHWSADGRLIVYASDQTGNFEVYVMNADGSGKRQLTADSGFSSIWPSFSRDGSTIVFSRCSHFLGTCDVALMRSDGSNIRSLVGGYWHHNQPVFSPHGMQIAFNSDEGGYDGLLWTVNAHGANPQTVTQPQVQFGFAARASRLVAGRGAHHLHWHRGRGLHHPLRRNESPEPQRQHAPSSRATRQTAERWWYSGRTDSPR